MKLKNTHIWIIMAVLSVAIIILVAFAWINWKEGQAEEASKEESVALVIPEGISEDVQTSKIDAYKGQYSNTGSRYEEYFNSLSAEQENDEINNRPYKEDNLESDDVGGVYVSSASSMFGKPHEDTSKPVLPHKMPSYEERQRTNAKIAKEVLEDLRGENNQDTKQDIKDSEDERKKEEVRQKEKPQTIYVDGIKNSSDEIISSWDDIDDDSIIHYNESNVKPVKCMFVKDENLASGQRVTIRLLEELKLENGVIIPKNTHLSGSCSINERLNINVYSIEMNDKIIPVGYEAYDIDGMKGIYCRETGGNKANGRVLDDVTATTQSVLGGMVGRVASAALSTGASVLQSSTGIVKVSIQSGYQFYLYKDKNE